MVYAIDNDDSFKKLDYWYKTIKENCSENVILEKNCNTNPFEIICNEYNQIIDILNSEEDDE